MHISLFHYNNMDEILTTTNERKCFVSTQPKFC